MVQLVKQGGYQASTIEFDSQTPAFEFSNDPRREPEYSYSNLEKDYNGPIQMYDLNS